MSPSVMPMIPNTHRTARRALLATGLVTLGSCQFDITGVPVERPVADGSTRAPDATARSNPQPSMDASTLPWMPPLGLLDAGPRDGQGWPGLAKLPDAADPNRGGFPPRDPADAVTDGSLEAGPPEAGAPEASLPTETPEPACPVRSGGDAPSPPYTLQLHEIERRSEPAFANRPLATVAENGAHRLWLFRQAFRAESTQQTVEGGLPLAAYDTSDVADLTLAPRLPLAFTVAAGPLVTRLPDEPNLPGTLENVSFEVHSFVPHLAAQRGGALFFVKRVGFHSAGVWLADVAPGSAHATRRAAAVFGEEQREYAQAAFRGEQYLTVYACDYDSASCTVARAPHGSEERADAYEVRTRDASGSSRWTRDLATATPVISGVHADLTVSYNAYLRQYLAAHLEARPFEQAIVLQTAPAPEGPWQPFATVPVSGTPLSFIRHAREQPALADRCGKRIALSYFEPDTLAGAFPASGKTVLSYVELP